MYIAVYTDTQTHTHTHTHTHKHTTAYTSLDACACAPRHNFYANNHGRSFNCTISFLIPYRLSLQMFNFTSASMHRGISTSSAFINQSACFLLRFLLHVCHILCVHKLLTYSVIISEQLSCPIIIIVIFKRCIFFVIQCSLLL